LLHISPSGGNESQGRVRKKKHSQPNPRRNLVKGTKEKSSSTRGYCTEVLHSFTEGKSGC